jgi:hypothetical protein
MRGTDLVANAVCSGQEGTAAEVAMGRIESILPDRQQIVLKDSRGQAQTFHLIKDARVLVNEKEGKLADLKPGREATVCYQLRAHAVTSNR